MGGGCSSWPDERPRQRGSVAVPGAGERESGRATALRIGELARRTGLTQRTIRYYEEEGLLPSPGRGRPRTYSERDVRALELVRGLKAMGSTLAEIRRYLRALEAAPERRGGPSRDLGELRRRIEGRIAELEALVRALPGPASAEP